MSLEENKTIVRRLIEELNKRNIAILDELMVADYVEHTLQLRSREEYKQAFNVFIRGFPDYHETIEDIIAEGDKVWVHFRFTGTHTGEYRVLAPTGKKITWTGVIIWRIVDGKVAENWGVSDSLDFLEQIGVIEYTEKAKGLFQKDVK